MTPERKKAAREFFAQIVRKERNVLHEELFFTTRELVHERPDGALFMDEALAEIERLQRIEATAQRIADTWDTDKQISVWELTHEKLVDYAMQALNRALGDWAYSDEGGGQRCQDNARTWHRFLSTRARADGWRRCPPYARPSRCLPGWRHGARLTHES